MKLSKNWLKRYLDVPYSDGELAEMLTTIGLEVEGVEQVETIKGGLQGVVIGEVKTCVKHPNADKLSLTEVDLGGDRLYKIVCGAPNVAAGQKVLVATVGTTIYTDDGSFEIKKSKIRGEESEGMICAEDELGLGQSHDGILVLPSDAVIGMAAAEYFQVTTDTVFDIGLTPNRSDATSQFGVAMDLAAYIKINRKEELELKEPRAADFTVENHTTKIEVEVVDAQRCPRYTALVISDVQVGESPAWLKNLLKSIGVKPINNVVDATNFVLHELGQPLHAFNFDRIGGKKVVVKCLPPKTSFKALDERVFELTGEDLMICDGEGNGLCMAGIYGGLNSGVDAQTATVFLESAHFAASGIRKSSMGHNLRTDAAKVFEKGSDPNLTLLAIKRAASLIVSLTGGKVTSEIFDFYPVEAKPVEVHLRYQRVRDLIGYPFKEDQIHDILQALDMEIIPVDHNGIRVKVPTNKADVLREVDLIEEILRIFGFNEIPIPQTLKSNLSSGSLMDKNAFKQRIGNHLSSLGYCEMMAMSIVESEAGITNLGWDESELIYINNTSNVGLDCMRPDMMVSSLNALLHNVNRQQSDQKLFEFGRTYARKGEAMAENEYLTLLCSGNMRSTTWLDRERPADFYYLKGSVHSVLNHIGISGYQEEESSDVRFQYGLRYFRGPKTLVTFGKVHPRIMKNMGIKQDAYFAEFSFEPLLQAGVKHQVSVSELSKFPEVRRDLAVVLDDAVRFSEVEALVRKNTRGLLKSVDLFDVYTNAEQLGANKKSYAVSMIFESADKTLEEKELEDILGRLINAFEKQLGAIIRR